MTGRWRVKRQACDPAPGLSHCWVVTGPLGWCQHCPTYDAAIALAARLARLA